jgi:hypothetical protein
VNKVVSLGAGFTDVPVHRVRSVRLFRSAHHVVCHKSATLKGIVIAGISHALVEFHMIETCHISCLAIQCHPTNRRFVAQKVMQARCKYLSVQCLHTHTHHSLCHARFIPRKYRCAPAVPSSQQWFPSQAPSLLWQSRYLGLYH